MPLNIIGTLVVEGTQGIPGWQYIKTYAPPLLSALAIKYYCGGAINTWERNLHGKVYMVTGGSSGLGSAVVQDLAVRGAHLIILTSRIDTVVDYISDLREKSGNIMIYAEECDLGSLYSVRKFATKWLDNSPARRLDGVICCAGESIPVGSQRQVSVDGVEKQIAINYLGHFHLLTLLSPAFRVQPPDRDVRIVVTSCVTQAVGEIDLEDPLWLNKRYQANRSWKVFGSSKLMLSLFAKQYQRQIDSIPRKDGMDCKIRINIVNPGIMRSPSSRRMLSFGSVVGLFVYLLLWPLWFILLKTCEQGAQSVCYTVMSPQILDAPGGLYIQECANVKPARKEFEDEELQQKLFDKTGELIEQLEKQSAIERKKQGPKGEKNDGEKKDGKTGNKDGKKKHEKDMPLFPDLTKPRQNESTLEQRVRGLDKKMKRKV